jgi:hypothetical protein
MRTVIAMLVVLMTVQPLAAAAQVQDGAHVWRTFAEKIEVGARIKVRLQDGRRVSATLVQAGEDALLIQPRTRVAVPVQPVPYAAIASIERDVPGMSVGKAAAIGVGAGAATFFGVFLIMLAVFAD